MAGSEQKGVQPKRLQQNIAHKHRIHPYSNFKIMNSIKHIFLTAIAMFGLACTSDDDTGIVPSPERVQLKVIGRGTAIGQPRTIGHPKTGETLESVCFLMDLVDPDTGNVIGTLQDCVVDNVTHSDGTILSRVITSININGRGTIQAENQVLQTLRPPAEAFTFTTSFTPIGNNVINTTFEFEGMEGTVALDGEVNLTNFDQGIVTFDCNFTIALEL